MNPSGLMIRLSLESYMGPLIRVMLTVAGIFYREAICFGIYEENTAWKLAWQDGPAGLFLFVILRFGLLLPLLWLIFLILIKRPTGVRVKVRPQLSDGRVNTSGHIFIPGFLCKVA